MKIVNKLSQLLNIDEHQHGIISEISKETGLSRHQVRDLIHNDTRSIRYDTLAKMCQYLIDHELVDPAVLPGALLGFAPNEFWPLLSERRRIDFCLGARRDEQWYDELVMAADSQLQALLTHRITQYRSLTSKQGSNGSAARDGQIFEQWLITAPQRDGSNEQEFIDESHDIIDHFDSHDNDKALICLGSVRSNSVIERIMAQCFHGTVAFETQDEVETVSNRTCPFTMVSRRKDPRLNSCCAGRQLSSQDPDSGPGIYFERPDFQWEHVPWSEQHDGAIVFYRYNQSNRNLVMCLGGYSSRGTRFLADFLHSGDADGQLWPPAYDDGEVQVGLFVLEFTLDGDDKKNAASRSSVRHQKPKSTHVHAVANEVIRRHIAKRSKSAKKGADEETVKPR